jgi:hypothetical protein
MIKIIFLLLLAAIAKASMDRLKTTIKGSLFDKYCKPASAWRLWLDPATSWRFKWLGGDPNKGAAFFGASTFFVWITDGWHFFQQVFLISIFLTVIIYKPIFSPALDFALLFTFFCVSFEIFYRLLNNKN